MKTENKIIILSIAMGVSIWVVDSFLDYLIFYEGTFTGLLITDVPRHDLYIRLLIMVCFTAFGFICSWFIAEQKKTEQKLGTPLSFQQQLLDTIPVPIFIKNEDYIYIGCNKSFEKFLGMAGQDIIGKSVHDLAPVELAAVYHEKDSELINNPGVQIYEFEVKSKTNGSNHQVVFHKATFEKPDGRIGGLIGAILDITERKNAEKEKEKSIAELLNALDQVKLLSGFLPICASCKKIRDDKGYWNQIESYIKEHSEAEFSHSICPECAKKLYPEFLEKSPDK